MHHDMSSYRHRIVEANAMLRLPTAPEFWGFAGPHQIHDLPPLGFVVLCRWLGRSLFTIGSWLVTRLRRPNAAPPPTAREAGSLRNDTAVA